MGISNQVSVACAVCKTEWTVKASRARQNASITCSKECLREHRRRSRIQHFQSEYGRKGVCATCGASFERKPSQLAKYGQNFCSRSCKAAGIRGPQPARRTGRDVPCETCGVEVWRTPATIQPHTYCSRACAAKAPRIWRVERVARPCAQCDAMMILLPSHARRYRFCSLACAAQSIQGAKRGKPGKRWTPDAKAKLTVSLLVKYQQEWSVKAENHSALMTGPGNPQWRGGRSLKGYAPGFTPALKRRIAKRDDYRCRSCGSPRGNGTHAVHHIDGEKHDHSENNLVLLCCSCHARIHGGSLVLTPDP